MVQGLALVAIAVTRAPLVWAVALVTLGVGTALVYPTLLAEVADIARPSWRAATMGVYRLWRDLGYVAGALNAGALADAFGVGAAIGTIGVLTAMSGAMFGLRFREIAVSKTF